MTPQLRSQWIEAAMNVGRSIRTSDPIGLELWQARCRALESKMMPALYPAYECRMGDTLVREVEDQADDLDAQWRKAVGMQMIQDRVAGLR